MHCSNLFWLKLRSPFHEYIIHPWKMCVYICLWRYWKVLGLIHFPKSDQMTKHQNYLKKIPSLSVQELFNTSLILIFLQMTEKYHQTYHIRNKQKKDTTATNVKHANNGCQICWQKLEKCLFSSKISEFTKHKLFLLIQQRDCNAK